MLPVQEQAGKSPSLKSKQVKQLRVKYSSRIRDFQFQGNWEYKDMSV